MPHDPLKSFKAKALSILMPRYLVASFSALICVLLAPAAALYLVILAIFAIIIYPLMILFVINPDRLIAFIMEVPMMIVEEMRDILGIDVMLSFVVLPVLHKKMRCGSISRYVIFPFLGALTAVVLGLIQGLAFFQLLFALLGGLVAARAFDRVMQNWH